MKRPVIATLVGIVAFNLVASLYGQAAKPAADTTARPEITATANAWRLFRGDSFASGVAAVSLPDQLPVKWRFQVPDGSFESTPVIADGTVYLGDLDGRLYAIGLDDGLQRWAYQTESGFVAAAAVSQRNVYAGDYDGVLHCVDIKTGEKKWTYVTNGEIDGGINFFQGNILFGSQDATLYCLDPNGNLVWKHQIQDQIRCSPTIVQGRCFVAGCDQVLHIIDVKTGQAIGGVPINAPTGVTPAVQGDLVFFGTEAGEVLAVNWQQAKVAWTFADERSSQPIRSCPAVHNGIVVIGGRSKKVYGLDAKTGREKWTFPTKNRVDAAPVIAGDRVYVGSGDGRFYGLRLEDGKKTWQYDTGSAIVGSAAVVANHIVVANEGGVVYCFSQSAAGSSSE